LRISGADADVAVSVIDKDAGGATGLEKKRRVAGESIGIDCGRGFDIAGDVEHVGWCSISDADEAGGTDSEAINTAGGKAKDVGAGGVHASVGVGREGVGGGGN